MSLSPEVSGIFSLTPHHFINAWLAGQEHFHRLLNLIISDINLSTLEELNAVFAVILYKGHGKDRTSERSYRTISTCTVLAKALDSYIGDLYSGGWARQ